MRSSLGTDAAQRVMQADVADGMATVLRALADPLRLQIVSALATAADGRTAAGEVAGDGPAAGVRALGDASAADVVITMGCGDNCPVLLGKRYEDWAVGDRALASPAGVRAILDDLEVRVRALAADLTNASAPTPAQETS